MDVDLFPRHLVIIGGSYIGVEFAQMYGASARSNGHRESAAHLGREDSGCLERGRTKSANDGVDIERARSACAQTARRQIAVESGLRRPAARSSGSHVLLAVGRVPNTGDLGVDKAGIVKMRAATSPSTTSYALTLRMSGRSATATAAAHSLTRRTTTMRSSPTICSTANTAACAIASLRTDCLSIHRSDAPV